jgi:hypothetical protein
MARYFNRTRSSVAIGLNGGGSVYIPAKSWMHIPEDKESSADIARCLAKKYLVRFEDVAEKTPTSAKDSGTSSKEGT